MTTQQELARLEAFAEQLAKKLRLIPGLRGGERLCELRADCLKAISVLRVSLHPTKNPP